MKNPLLTKIVRSSESAADHSSREAWIERLATPAVSIPVAQAEQRFGLLLQAARWNSGLLALPVWLRPSKSGGRRAGSLVDPQPLTLEERCGPTPAPVDGWTQEVSAALALLLRSPVERISGKNWIRIHTSFEESALESLLAAFPAWYERASCPIVRGPAMSARPAWKEEADGSQRLGFELAERDAVVLRGAGLWYVRPEAGLYGRIDADARLFDLVAQAQLLGPMETSYVRGRLGASPSAKSLPPPIARERVPVTGHHPAPVLKLRAGRLRAWGGEAWSIGLAVCECDYDGLRLNLDATGGIVTRVLEDRIVELHRDLDAEARFEETLRGCGVVPLLDTGIPDQWVEGADSSSFWVALSGARRPPLEPERWRPALETLARAGFRLEYGAGFPHEDVVEVDSWVGELAPATPAWFDVTLGIEVAGERVDLLPILRSLVADPAFPLKPQAEEKPDALWRIRLDETRTALLPLTRLRALIEPILEWLEAGEGTARVHRSQMELIEGLGIPWRGDALRAALERVSRRAAPPDGFTTVLRPYQREGLAWLNFLADSGVGGILADEMGLGKTVEVLAHILSEKQRGKLIDPVLVIAPTSLVSNWAEETARFAPSLKVLVLHGPDRAGRYRRLPSTDLAITTYPLLLRDHDLLAGVHFPLVVLDEAQFVKNAASQTAREVRAIAAERRLAMTGTPLENHLGELWAQFDAVEPGLLGSLRQFTRTYRTPIEKRHDQNRQRQLNRRIRPLLLRRRKEDVLPDLPPKTEIVRRIELEGAQRDLYETLRAAQQKRVREALRKRGLAQSAIVVLDALLKLRQVRCDPRLVKLDSARCVKESAKLDALLELLEGLLTSGRRVLLFSQFTEMLGLITVALRERRIGYEMLTGDTPSGERGERIRRFQKGGTPLFLISLKAGGVGLNLTAADTVIHYDPWWNPAVEQQTTGRAHRIGQTKPVFVYRLVTVGTVEEKIEKMQQEKAGLAQAVLDGGSSAHLSFAEEDLEALFAPA